MGLNLFMHAYKKGDAMLHFALERQCWNTYYAHVHTQGSKLCTLVKCWQQRLDLGWANSGNYANE